MNKYLIIGSHRTKENHSRPMTLTEVKRNIGYWLETFGKVQVVEAVVS
jgi:hypothetical protein